MSYDYRGLFDLRTYVRITCGMCIRLRQVIVREYCRMMLNELFPKRTSLALLNLHSSLNLLEFMISRSVAYYNMIACKQSRTRHGEEKPNVFHWSNRISSRGYYREKDAYVSLASTYILFYVFPCIPRKYQALGPRPFAPHSIIHVIATLYAKYTLISREDFGSRSRGHVQVAPRHSTVVNFERPPGIRPTRFCRFSVCPCAVVPAASFFPKPSGRILRCGPRPLSS